MRTLRLKIADLFQFDGQPPAHGTADAATITSLVLQQFSFLPQPLTVTIEGDEVLISFPEESTAAQAEAARLAQKAGRHAAKGDFSRAIDLLNRALHLQPSLHNARRDLAMCCMETGDIDAATNHLIELLRLDPTDAAHWVVLGNLYLGHRKDPQSAESFLRKAIALQPDNAWALNSLAAIVERNGQHNEAVSLFESAIAAQPSLPNPYYGLAVAFDRAEMPDQASASLLRLFNMGLLQDSRSRAVYDQARRLFVKTQSDLAERHQSDVFKAILNYRSDTERLSGFPVVIDKDTFKDSSTARTQLAWRHGRDHHLITLRESFPDLLLPHIEAHELTHIQFDSAARAAGRNKLFATNPDTRSAALADIAPNVRKLQQAGYPTNTITGFHDILVSGLCGLIYNIPLDMIIERHLHRALTILRPVQFLSTRTMALEALKANTSKDIAAITPRRIHRAVLALNGAYCLSLDALFSGASGFADPYRQMEHFDTAQQLHQLWLDRAENLKPGDEFSLIDSFADLLGIRSWYTWNPDSIAQAPASLPQRPDGITDPNLLREKHPAAVRHLLDALIRFDQLTPDQIQAITFEIGRTGQQGINYSNPQRLHHLDSLPGESFSGLELICLLFAGFKRLYPETDTGIDLDEPFLKALELLHLRSGSNPP